MVARRAAALDLLLPDPPEGAGGQGGRPPRPPPRSGLGGGRRATARGGRRLACRGRGAGGARRWNQWLGRHLGMRKEEEAAALGTNPLPSFAPDVGAGGANRPPLLPVLDEEGAASSYAKGALASTAAPTEVESRAEDADADGSAGFSSLRLFSQSGRGPVWIFAGVRIAADVSLTYENCFWPL